MKSRVSCLHDYEIELFSNGKSPILDIVCGI